LSCLSHSTGSLELPIFKWHKFMSSIYSNYTQLKFIYLRNSITFRAMTIIIYRYLYFNNCCNFQFTYSLKIVVLSLSLILQMYFLLPNRIKFKFLLFLKITYQDWNPDDYNFGCKNWYTCFQDASHIVY
jgi:hypothetical protein